MNVFRAVTPRSRLGVLIVITGLSVLACYATVGAASAGPSRRVPLSSSTPGIYVSGIGRVAPSADSSAFVVDSQRRDHLVTLVSTAGEDHVDYYWHSAHHGGAWSVERLNRTFSHSLNPKIEIATVGRRIDVVVYTCAGVYASQSPASAKRISRFSQVTMTNQCGNGPTVAVPIVALRVPGGAGIRLAVLAQEPSHPALNELLVGNPGRPFRHLGDLPSGDENSHYFFSLVASDGVHLTAVGYGVSGLDNGDGERTIFATRLSWVRNDQTAAYDAQWSTPRNIATFGDAAAGYFLDAVTAFHGGVTVGLYNPGADGIEGLDIVRMNHHGRWFAPAPLPRTGVHDNHLILANNPATGGLHAVFQRQIRRATHQGRSGIMAMHMNKRGTEWLPPVYVTHRRGDVPRAVSVESGGHATIAYRRR